MNKLDRFLMAGFGLGIVLKAFFHMAVFAMAGWLCWAVFMARCFKRTESRFSKGIFGLMFVLSALAALSFVIG